MMAHELIVIGFPAPHSADAVLLTLTTDHEDLVDDLEGAAVVVRKENGELRLRQSTAMVADGFEGGSIAGLLAGALFLNPLAGTLSGKASGRSTGALIDYGIEDEFIVEVGRMVEPGTSALFVAVHHPDSDRLTEALRPYEGVMLRSSLSIVDEKELRKALIAPGHTAA